MLKWEDWFMKRKVAVFDIDGTIFRSSLLIELVERLISDGVFPVSARSIYLGPQKNWLDRRDSYEKYIMAVVAAFDRNLKGVREEDLKKAAARVVAEHQFRVYRYTRDLILDLRKKGYFLLAISHSPKMVVEKFAKGLGFDKVYGRMFELDQKRRFTGRGYYLELIEDKARILKRAAEKSDLTLRGSVGVGDTDSDTAFLKLVEKPICFNPNLGLYRIAKRNRWPVVVERKDVIYTIKF